MPGKARPSLRAKTLLNVDRSNLSITDKKCIHHVFEEFEEVKHGRWIAQYNGSLKPIYRCSVCNERLIGYSDPNKVLYCHCGAKMDDKV